MAFKRISCQQAKQIISTEESTIIDIRDKASFVGGHIENAIHVDQDNVTTFIESANKAQPLIVCCYHGNLSQGAADYFGQQGFQQAYSLDGGFSGWDNG